MFVAGHAETRSPWLRAEPGPEPEYPDVTVTAAWLARRLDARDVLVIDVRPAASYLAGHVPGAVSFPPELVPEVVSLPELARLPDVLGDLGLSGRELLICCGEVSYSREAAGLFWLLEVAGADRVAVLDGGVVGWCADGRELASEDVRRPPATWTREPDPELLATREYVRRSFGEPGVEIVDARGLEAWRGPVESEDWGSLVRAGHIPHALPFDFTTFFAPDGRFLPPSETWSSFAKLGPRPANPVDLSDEFVVHGWGGVGDADSGQWEENAWGDGPLAYFLLRRAGIAGVRLYSGGWADWVGDPYLPIVRIVTAEELMHRLGKSRRWLRPNAPPGDFAFSTTSLTPSTSGSTTTGLTSTGRRHPWLHTATESVAYGAAPVPPQPPVRRSSTSSGSTVGWRSGGSSVGSSSAGSEPAAVIWKAIHRGTRPVHAVRAGSLSVKPCIVVVVPASRRG
jgi:thiosulfate/3-mercaptopyruvate sulfurtransferase